jgi:hypothetical protein
MPLGENNHSASPPVRLDSAQIRVAAVLQESIPFATEVVDIGPHAPKQQLRGRRRDAGALQHANFALLSADLPAQARDLILNLVSFTARSDRPYVAEYPDDLRVTEIAGRWNSRPAEGNRPGTASFARQNLARITAALALMHSTASPGATPSSAAAKGSATCVILR